MKIKKINLLITFVICVFIVIVRQNVLYANSGVVGFSVTPIIPENQNDKKLGYFDLKLEPGQKQNIDLKISNTSDKATKFNVDITFAKTNTNGLVEYTETDKSKADETLKFPFSAIATTNDSVVEVLANESKVVTINIEMPKEQFDGIILGGLHVTKNYEEEMKEQSKEEGLAITNQFSYVVGVKLSETDVLVKPEINLKYIKPTLHNHRTAIAANIQNSEAVMIPKAKIEARVYKVGSDVAINTTIMSDFDIAPNSNVDLMIDWKNKEIESGDYRLYMKLETEERTWEWDELFKIEGKEIKEINDNAIEIEKDNTMMYVIIVSVVLFFIVMILLALSKRGVFEKR